MRVVATKKFLKELEKIQGKERKYFAQMYQLISETDVLTKLSSVKKMQGYDNFYRYRIGDYRVGIVLNGEIVELRVIAHRKDIYKRFP